MDKNPPLHLIHRTAFENAKLILKEGFDPTLPTGSNAILLARCKLRGLEPEQEEFFRCVLEEEDDDYENRARKVFNEVLDRAREDPDLPGHEREAVFFWPSATAADKLYAQNIEKAKEAGQSLTPSCQLVVDAEKIPCECYEGDAGVVGSLYWLIHNNLDLAEACLKGETPSGLEAQDFFDHIRGCAAMEGLAKHYYDTMQPIDDKTPYKPLREVLCPCEIPKEAVVDTDCTEQHELPFEETS